MSVVEPRRPVDRARCLDGLRGVAAVVVVIGHVLYAVPSLAPIPQQRLHAGGWAWWLADTPLRALWNGYNAVLVFFVLSGFVLVVGRQRWAVPDWLAYYPARLIRLYVPVAGALLLFVVLAKGIYTWTPFSAGSVLHDLVLVRGADGFNLPLWSLQWEVVFSGLLPLYVLFARIRPALWPLKVLALLAIIAVGTTTEHQTLLYLPVFALGAVLAVQHEQGTFDGLAAAVAGRYRRPVLWLVVAVTIIGYNAKALAAAPGEPSPSLANAAGVAEVLGALLVVGFALYTPRLRGGLEGRVCQWLGTRSFSLYLTHWAIIPLIGHTFGRAGVLVLVLPVALAVAEVFHRVVEGPSHRLARRVRVAVRTRNAHREAGVTPGRTRDPGLPTVSGVALKPDDR